jgi:hypothetical protein
MRTTLTLDDDVAALLEQLREDRGYRFKEAVNLALREGLLRLRKPRQLRGEPYRTPVVSLGRPRLPSLDNITGVLAVAEGDDYR